MEMAEIKAAGGPAYRNSPSPHYQEVIAGDGRSAPALFREYSEADIPLDSVSRAEYVSPAFEKLERERMWPRVWQLACREEQIPEEGDCHVYEGPDASILVVRGDDGAIRAFHNSCPHRGMKICVNDTSLAQIKCPFHSISWDLDGKVANVPARWDFPDSELARLHLKEVRASVWQGFVFINRDLAAPPLEQFLGHLVPHFEDWRYDDMYVDANIRRPIDANWKTCVEAFLEAYHLSGIHAQALPFGGESSTQYDVWEDDPHVSRFVEPTGVASDQFPKALSEQEIMEFATRTVYGDDAEVPALGEGMRAREFMAEGARQAYGAMHGRDYSSLSDAEAVDAVQYHLFPNMVIFRTLMFPYVYRFIPVCGNPDQTTFEFWVFKPKPEGEEVPETKIYDIDRNGSYADAGVLPDWHNLIYDQDADGLRQCQDGMREGGDDRIRFTRYQESRLRLLHQTLQRYVSDNPADAPGRG